ncbi:uncharacterized protein FOMMEDRAFT_138304 [Fomitiporia mediterranea MF3/22]|uniref:uncharacterized protein n=1 Tax=Fomitiporia mediterranea (strain MF3/22) TaxID=694068 RepID=UPI0004407B44|nr:uncharacterized protein FOMMEDRAFT_138304 [Fomitiporia mediterranea MF3/22]EJD08542.1 hypothetical protein FOMMEDRAFT_138304 [Fomitiporia mediterranea MF3/22]
MTSDGHKLQDAWANSLKDALTTFRTHLTSAQSSAWKRVPLPLRKNSSGSVKGKSPRPDARDVCVHRRTTKAGDVYRVILEFPATDDTIDLEVWKAVLVTPELRGEWDPAVESAQVLEMFDPSTRIVKTNFTLGWPANPRDAVLISRTFYDATTLVDVSTSLPRSADEPSYLRPSPPYVRSRVDLFAWCIQILSPEGRAKRVRMTCFWQHDLRTVWNIGAPVNVPQQLSTMTIGLLDAMKSKKERIPVLSSYGLGVAIGRIIFDIGRAALTIDYEILPEDHDTVQDKALVNGLDDLYTLRQQRRLQRSLEVLLPSRDGWDIRIATRASSEAVAQLPWSANTIKWGSSKVSFQIQHAPLLDDHSVLKVKLIMEFSAALKGVRINGLPKGLEERIDHELESFATATELFQDASSAAAFSVGTANSSAATAASEASSDSSVQRPPFLRTDSNTGAIPRGPAFDKSILARVRRNYIYFSSLLQEPEAKWKRNSDIRGVSVTQLDSIDPTLVVYKAEATFVGIGLWDLYSTIVTPGTRAQWDRQYDDATMLEDVNELTELWHYKTKPAWPVTGRDCVLLKTVYKSPTTVHVFSFSIDDQRLFPAIPPVDPGTIRTQVDLQGWAIESLSPTTTQLTLLEQSDPKGWAGKATVPQQMVANVAGVGEFAIKCGGPPVVTRLSGARSINQRYDHDRAIFRVEYEPAADRRPNSTQESTSRPLHTRQNSVDCVQMLATGASVTAEQAEEESSSTSIECELRCDVDTWASSLDIVIDPPPQSILCLRRHRLSAGGGGLWLSVGHDISFNSEERLQVIIRRAPLTAAKERGVVMVNGKRINVDVEELPEAEVKSLTKQKRVKPARVPLDQPPVMGVIRRRRAELDDGDSNGTSTDSGRTKRRSGMSAITSTVPKVPSPLSTFFTTALEQVTNTTQQAVAVFVPPAISSTDVTFPATKRPVHFALDALAFAQAYHHGAYRDNWTTVTDNGILVQRRPSPNISPAVPVHRGEKVIEGVTADEVASVVFSYDCRRQWDDRFDSVFVLEEYGADCHTSFLVSKTGFPFRDRGMLLASLVAREKKHTTLAIPTSNSEQVQTPAGISNAIYCISASFNPTSTASFSPTKYNVHTLPVGRIYIDAWILETLDPYTSENYAIPSTKCMRLVAADFAGSVPVAFNSMINASLPRAILAVDAYMKTFTPFPEMRLPSAYFCLTGTEIDIEGRTWRFKPGNMGPILLSSKLDVPNKIFRANLLVTFDGQASESERALPSDGKEAEPSQVTPRSDHDGISSRPGSPDILRRRRRESTSPLSPSRRHRKSMSADMDVTPNSARVRSHSREPMRTSSSTFSIGRDQKTRGPMDYVVAEIIIDMRTHPEGYEVQFTSRMERNGNSPSPIQFTHIDEGSNDASSTLPIAHNVIVIPPSPLYTANTGVDTPVRHLLRLTLPTSQFELPTVEDPLTGEMRSAPPKPQWYVDLESRDKYALVQVAVRPLPTDKRKKGKKLVLIDGAFVSPTSERDINKGAILEESGVGILSSSQIQDGEDCLTLPMRLSSPLVVNDLLLGESQAETRPHTIPSTTDSQSDNQSGDSEMGGTEEHGPFNTSRQATPTEEQKVTRPAEEKRGLFSLISSYQASLPLLGRSRPTGTYSNQDARKTSAPNTSQVEPEDLQSSSRPELVPLPGSSSNRAASSALAVVQSARVPRFSISALIASMLIAFLLGSLLRSLLSPADFIYVVTDLGDVPGGVTRGPNGGLGTVEPGWREIKRLVELKYIVGGWDFQIAVVRRH